MLDLFGNPEDGFCRDAAQLFIYHSQKSFSLFMVEISVFIYKVLINL